MHATYLARRALDRTTTAQQYYTLPTGALPMWAGRTTPTKVPLSATGCSVPNLVANSNGANLGESVKVAPSVCRAF